MRVLVIGDPHFKNDKLVMMDIVCDEIIDIINEKTPDLVVCLGDVLHKHSKIDIDPLCQSSKFFFRISEKVQLIILSGNHDRRNNSDYMSEVSSVYPLSMTPNIKVINKAYWDKENGKNFIYVPYVPAGMFRKALSEIGYDPTTEGDKPLCIFAHQEFTNAKSNGRLSTCSEGWSVNNPLIVTGHYHDYHWVSESLLYTGSLFQESYKEDPDKALILITFKNGERDIERIALKSVIKKMEIDVTAEDLDNVMTIIEKLPKDYLIKVKLHVNSLQSMNIQKHKGYEILKANVDKIDIIPDVKYITEIDKTISKLHKEGNLTLESVTRNMLKDDAYVLSIFDSIPIHN